MLPNEAGRHSHAPHTALQKGREKEKQPNPNKVRFWLFMVEHRGLGRATATKSRVDFGFSPPLGRSRL